MKDRLAAIILAAVMIALMCPILESGLSYGADNAPQNYSEDSLNTISGSAKKQNGYSISEIGINPNYYDGYDEYFYYQGRPHLKEIIELAKSLTSNCSNDRKKALAVYDWIANNIEYEDNEAAEDEYAAKGNWAGDGSGYAFENRFGVCGDYCALTADMLRAVGVPCVVAHDEEMDHCCNLVFWDNRWHILDTTWAGGNVFEDDYIHYYFDIAPSDYPLDITPGGIHDVADIKSIYVTLDNPNYHMGDALNEEDNISINVIKEDASVSKFFPSEYARFSGYDMSRPGKQTVTVEIGNPEVAVLRTAFNICVSKSSSLDFYDEDSNESTNIQNLSAVKITKPKTAKKSVVVKWKKVSKVNRKKIAKIQIQYSTDKNFKKGVKSVYAKNTATSKKIKKLKSKKQYFFRVRAYKKVNGVVHVSKWSKVMKATVK